jgi:heme-degrading monooxygenase HmoA
VEHTRLTLFTADPARTGDLARFVRRDVVRCLDVELGHLGLEVLVDDELGVIFLETFWVSGDAMHSSEHVEAPLRKEAQRQGAATASVERFAVPIFAGARRPEPGAWSRLTRFDVERRPEESDDSYSRRVDEAVEVFEDAALPWLETAPGFFRASLLVHARQGRGMTESVWEDERALAASRSADATARADAGADVAVRGLYELRVLFSSVRPS